MKELEDNEISQACISNHQILILCKNKIFLSFDINKNIFIDKFSLDTDLKFHYLIWYNKTLLLFTDREIYRLNAKKQSIYKIKQESIGLGQKPIISNNSLVLTLTEGKIQIYEFNN
jgi:hypothetical protein